MLSELFQYLSPAAHQHELWRKAKTAVPDLAGLSGGLINCCVCLLLGYSLWQSRCVALGFNVPVSFNDSPALLCKLLRYFHALCYLSWCLNCISSAIFKKDVSCKVLSYNLSFFPGWGRYWWYVVNTLLAFFSDDTTDICAFLFLYMYHFPQDCTITCWLMRPFHVLTCHLSWGLWETQSWDLNSIQWVSITTGSLKSLTPIAFLFQY